jgi:hypothetical protein
MQYLAEYKYCLCYVCLYSEFKFIYKGFQKITGPLREGLAFVGHWVLRNIADRTIVISEFYVGETVIEAAPSVELCCYMCASVK